MLFDSPLNRSDKKIISFTIIFDTYSPCVAYLPEMCQLLLR